MQMKVLVARAPPEPHLHTYVRGNGASNSKVVVSFLETSEEKVITGCLRRLSLDEVDGGPLFARHTSQLLRDSESPSPTAFLYTYECHPTVHVVCTNML